MIRISQLKLSPDKGHDELEIAIRKCLRLRDDEKFSYEVCKHSLDARKKPIIYSVFTILVTLNGKNRENTVLKRSADRRSSGVIIERAQESVYRPRYGIFRHGFNSLKDRPIVVGTGPAGLFCGLLLARAGICPVLIERGQDVRERAFSVKRFWEKGVLDPESNVQFGEGGAGTFSDGKLNTGLRDPSGRIAFILRTFVEKGADSDVMYESRSHVGTDVLAGVVSRISSEIVARGGEIYFNTCLKDISKEEDGRWTLFCERVIRPLSRFDAAKKGYNNASENMEHEDESDCRMLSENDLGMDLEKNPEKIVFRSGHVVLAIGHSSRDTLRMLNGRGLHLSGKAFAFGVRIQHPQSLINLAMYGPECPYSLPPAYYALTHTMRDGRGVYSFCMCPGGYIVNASSREGMLAINGMSYRDRHSGCANSAIVVSVTPDDIRKFMYEERAQKHIFANPTNEESDFIESESNTYRHVFQREENTFEHMCASGQAVICSSRQEALEHEPGASSYQSLDEGPLLGIEFQDRLERIAYLQGKGQIPVQLFEDFQKNIRREGTPSFEPMIKGKWTMANVRGILPSLASYAIEEGILSWESRIKGFSRPDALIAGVESRTSSPVRIERGKDLQACGNPFLYPCGEGAGYAGGIVSSAIDGMKVAEKIIHDYS